MITTAVALEHGASSGAVSDLRAQIEQIDARLIATIAERVALARAIGRTKRAHHQPVVDPSREARVVQRAAQLARHAGLPEDDIRTLYWQLMAMARRAQMADEPRRAKATNNDI